MELAQAARSQWKSRLGAVLAAAGSAVGLGNIWKFPYLVGANGGAAFVLLYLAFVLLIGIPLIMTEFVVGRKTTRNPVGAFRELAPGTAWVIPGISGVVAGFLILSFYSVVAGWVLRYAVTSLLGALSGLNPEGAAALFTEFIGGTWAPLFWHLLFMALTVYIVAAGVQEGIEKWSKILMPGLFILVIILVIRSLTLPGSHPGIAYYLQPDFSALTGKSVLAALGQMFFSLSLGMGCMITYGSYISRQDSLVKTAGQVGLIDTLVALLAGLVIFPAAFAFGIEPGAGPGLVFITLPAIFAQMPLGQFFACLFFLLLAIAALTSSISLLETVVAYFVDEKDWGRRQTAVVWGGLAFLAGIPSALSQGAVNLTVFGLSFLDAVDYLTSNILLPLGGLLTALFVGWRMRQEDVLAEALQGGGMTTGMAQVWYFLVRTIAPLAIGLIFANAIGLF